MSHRGRLLVVGIGEAVFDCFSDRKILGGAPINFSVHARQLLRPVGGKAAVVSRVGRDDLGRQLMQDFAGKRLTTDHVQQDDRRPTGSVQVTLDAQGQPTYEIARDVAWDHITWSKQLEELAVSCSAVCFGTLAQRSPTSREAIQNFLHAAKQAIRILDINLRQDFYDATIIEQSLQLASVAKLNQEELQTTCDLLDLNNGTVADDHGRAFAICRRFDLDVVALTRGSAGTKLFTRAKCIDGSVAGYPHSRHADSVGAGDGCGAAIACGLLLGWPLEDVLDLANRAGAFIASQPGATPDLPKDLVSATEQFAQTDERPLDAQN